LALALVLCLIFLAGTGYALFFRKNGVPGSLGVSEVQGTQEAQGAEGAPGERIFTGIGRLRLSTAEPQSAMVILSITFPYVPEDRAFSEELAARVRDFRTITEDYFQSITLRDLRNKSEEQLKADLLERFNRILRLGKIPHIYFIDFMILEEF
jgi:flagellar FliL protein